METPTEGTEALDTPEESSAIEPKVETVSTATGSRAALKKKRKRKKIIRLSAIGAAVVILAGAGGYFAFGTAVVPAAPAHFSELLDGDPCEKFSDITEDCSVSFEHSDTAIRDSIISQTPEAGFSLTKPSSIDLVYSSGPEKSEFPDILRQDYDEAVKELYLLGLKVGVVKKVEKDDLGPNRIVSASIEPGAITKSGTKVDLEVSTETVVLPELHGLTREQAELDLQKLGLELEIAEEQSIEPVGTVISQSPAAGAVAKGSTVKVKIAKAEEVKNIKVPTVIGLTEEAAQGVIAAAGFKNIAVVKVESSKATSALVTHVAPGEGRTVRSDSNVVIVVSIPEAK